MDALQVANKLGAGHLLDEMHASLLRVAEDVVATGRDGRVTVTLIVKKPQGPDNVVVVQEAVTTSLPKSLPQGAMYFVDDGQFHERDPRQVEMELRVLDGGESELRDVGEEESAAEGTN